MLGPAPAAGAGQGPALGAARSKRGREIMQMMQWATEALRGASMGLAAVPLALLLGLVSAVASACCTLPAMGMLVAYSGTREDGDRRTALASAVGFMIGTTVALVLLGFVAGFVGQAAQALL